MPDRIGSDYRRPLVLYSYTLQGALGAASPASLHAANLLMHAGNAALLAGLVVATGGSAAAAFAAALLFGFHPLASGSVAYVSGRSDLLAALFTLGALLVCATGREGTGAAATDGARARAGGGPAGGAGSRGGHVSGGPGAGRLAASLLAVVAAAMSKESGVVAGPLVSALLWWRGGFPTRGRALVVAALPLVAGAALAMLLLPPAATAPVPAGLRLRGVGSAAVVYLQLLLWPSGLHLDRLTAVGPPLFAGLGALALLAAAAAIVVFVRRPSRVRLAAAAVAICWLPGSGLLPVYPAIADRFVFTGEQFLYLPLVPLAALVAGGAEGLALRGGSIGSRGAGLLVVAVALLVAASWSPSVLARQREFASAEVIYRRTLEHSPSPRACFNLGNLMLARESWAEAAAVYEQCTMIAPSDAAAHAQLALALQRMGVADGARRAYERSLQLDAGNARVWSNFATLDANAGRFDDAKAKWRRALELDPSDPAARSALTRLPD